LSNPEPAGKRTAPEQLTAHTRRVTKTMLAPLDTLDHLKARLREALGRRAPLVGDGILSLVLELPEVPTCMPRLEGAQFHLAHAHRGELCVGYGVAREWSAAGPERLSRLREQAERLSVGWSNLDPDETGFTGLALLGFAARPSAGEPPAHWGFPDALLWVPEVALRVRRGQAALVLSAPRPAAADDLRHRWTTLLDRLVPAFSRPAPGPLRPARLSRREDTPDASGWDALVRSALGRIRAGELEKVVVARRLRVEGSRRFDLGRLHTALRFFFPSCQILDIRRGGTSFVAATPERLLTLRGNRVEADALAGTASRAAEAQRDGALARALRSSPKNLHEHRLVVEAIREALGPCAARVEAADTPGIMQLNNAQHLWTRISAHLAVPTDIFTLAERLHPTPATNGQPRWEAGAWLQRADHFERGWYTGAAGIVEPDLSGELWVLLRCAAVRDHTADLYAGAGIVPGSDPALEWRETEDKLAAMLTALRFA
jgi:menaquinone-specific isochorismate synthase